MGPATRRCHGSLSSGLARLLPGTPLLKRCRSASGLAGPDRCPEVLSLQGKIPYSTGGSRDHGHDQLTDDPSGELVRRLDQEQMIRTGMNQLTERCQQVVRALFFDHSFPRYLTIAARLGL